MDGVRAYWNGKKLLSRQGNEYPAPMYFLEDLPNIPLDGELWMGRGKMDILTSTLKSKKVDWNQIKYYVFDLPELNEPFEMRYETLQKIKLPTHAMVVEFMKCQGLNHLNDHLDSILEKGGEGIMATEPQSFYQKGRTNSLLKIKRFDDSEVKVLEVLPTGLRCEQ